MTSEAPAASLMRASAAEIRRALSIVWPNRNRHELRILHPAESGNGRRHVDAGVFDSDHLDDLIDAAVHANTRAAVYVNLNPVKADYKPPALNAIAHYASGLIRDCDIERREYLPIDLDPIRPTDTSATAAHLASAQETAIKVQQYLSGQGWPAPIVCASGNGMHLLYRIDQPNDSASLNLIKAVLKELGRKFDTHLIKVDKTLANAGRIIKLYGTVANKGPNTPETPHRLSRVVEAPDLLSVVSHAHLVKETQDDFLSQRPDWHQPPGVWSTAGGAGSFNLDWFLQRLGIAYELEQATEPDGTDWYHLDHCPFNPEHGRKDSAIGRRADGRLGFKCFHDSCADKTWREVRALVDSGAPASEGERHAPAATAVTLPTRLPAVLKPVPALDPAALPATIRNAALDHADRLQCPPDYLAVAMLSAAGTVVGNKIGIFPRAHDESWEVYPCLWGGIVGNPGQKKTPALNAALAPLHHLEEQAGIAYVIARRKYEADRNQYTTELTAWKEKKVATMPTEPVEPKRQRYVVHDTTYQALGIILDNNPGGVIAVSDELSGLLQSLDAAGQEAARGFFLTGWGGTAPYSFDRVGRVSITLPRVCLSVFGGFQPDKIQAYVRHAQRGSSKNDGMLQRFQLMVWPDSLTAIRIVDRPPDKQAIDAYHAAVLRLATLVSSRIATAVRRNHGQQLLHFDPDAQQVYDIWSVANETLLGANKLDAARLAHLSKYRSLIPALALLFHLLDGHAGPVCVDCVKMAIRYAKYLKDHANRIYGSVSGHDYASTHALARKLLNGDLTDGFTCRTVVQKGWGDLASKEVVVAALDALSEHGWLTEYEKRTGGRPTVAYSINPGISADLLDLS